MAILPQKVGGITLVRALDEDGVCQRFAGILDDSAGTPVVVRRLADPLARDPLIIDRVRDRLGDLLALRHPSLLAVERTFEVDGSLCLVEQWRDAVRLDQLVAWCRDTDGALPQNLFLHIAVQICNALEALHNHRGQGSGQPHVLHLQIRPSSLVITRDGDVLLGDYALVDGPTFATHTGGYRLKTAYLSPEQTRAGDPQVPRDDDSGGRLSPASDLFSLGAVLYELLALRPMFHDSSPLRTLARVRRAEVTTQLLEIKTLFPGLDRVLYRALSVNPRHRYQSAFVLREDLRGLMASFSFSNIQDEARAFLAPLFKGERRASDDLLPRMLRAPPPGDEDNDPTVLARIDIDAIRRSASAMAAFPEDFDEPADFSGEAAPTGAFDLPAAKGPMERPVSYASEGAEAMWDEIQPLRLPRPSMPSGNLEAALGMRPETDDGDLSTEVEDLETEVDDLEPVPAPTDDVRLEDPSDAHDPHAETRILPVESRPLSPPPLDRSGSESLAAKPWQDRTTLVVSATALGVVAALLVLCGGGMTMAVFTRGGATDPQLTRVRPAEPMTASATPQPARLSPAEWQPVGAQAPAIDRAVIALDAGDWTTAIERAREARATADDLDGPLRQRVLTMSHQVEGEAALALFEAGQPPDHAQLDASERAWRRYAELVRGSPQLERRAAQRLDAIAARRP